MILLAAETPSDILRFYAGAVASCRENQIPLSLLAQLARSGMLHELAEKESAKLAPNFGAAYKVIAEQARALPRGRDLTEISKGRQRKPKPVMPKKAWANGQEFTTLSLFHRL